MVYRTDRVITAHERPGTRGREASKRLLRGGQIGIGGDVWYFLERQRERRRREAWRTCSSTL